MIERFITVRGKGVRYHRPVEQPKNDEDPHLSDLEISKTADELVTRLQGNAIVVSAVLTCLLARFALAIAIQNIVGTADVPATWNRTGGDRIGSLVILPLMVLPCAIVPPLICVACLRKRHVRGGLTARAESGVLPTRS